MPTCASAPIRSSSAISVAVVIPPAAVRRAGPAAPRPRLASAAAAAAGGRPPHPVHRPGVGAAIEGGIQIDDRHLPSHPELLEPGQGVAAVQHEVPAPAKLDRAALHQVDAGNDHRRTRIPWRERSALMPSTVSSPSWNTDAASTASAPARNASTTWARPPIPPE